MGNQWDNFLHNLGRWQGSFAQFSPEGEALSETPTLLLLEGLENDERARLTLQRFAPGARPGADEPVSELVREYRSFGRDILFFDDGAFSQGTIQLGPFSEFGAEFGFVDENRRLRLVELFAPEGHLKNLTLIRESRAGSEAVESPPLKLEQLLGTWEGTAQTLYPDWRSADVMQTRLVLEAIAPSQVRQTLSFTVGLQNGQIESIASIEGDRLHFEGGSRPTSVLLLPGGASATFPVKVERRQSFFIEAGWLVRPDYRQRLIRRYSDRGEWESLTLVGERKIDI